MAKKLKKTIPLDFTLDFTQKKYGFEVLLIGVIVAVLLGILAHAFAWGAAWIWLVLLIGVVVGILNIFHEEGVLFIVTLLTLTFMLNLLAGLAFFPVWVVTLFDAVIYLLTPVTVIVSLKVLYALAVK